MKPNEQTLHDIDRFLGKLARKFPKNSETGVMTDLHLRVNQDSGDLMAFNDDGDEITRCVVEQWIDNKDDNFYQQVALTLRRELERNRQQSDGLGILKPYSYVLEDEEGESKAELYVADDDTVILGGDLMEGLDKDLDSFFDDLMK